MFHKAQQAAKAGDIDTLMSMLEEVKTENGPREKQNYLRNKIQKLKETLESPEHQVIRSYIQTFNTNPDILIAQTRVSVIGKANAKGLFFMAGEDMCIICGPEEPGAERYNIVYPGSGVVYAVCYKEW